MSDLAVIQARRREAGVIAVAIPPGLPPEALRWERERRVQLILHEGMNAWDALSRIDVERRERPWERAFPDDPERDGR